MVVGGVLVVVDGVSVVLWMMSWSFSGQCPGHFLEEDGPVPWSSCRWVVSRSSCVWCHGHFVGGVPVIMWMVVNDVPVKVCMVTRSLWVVSRSSCGSCPRHFLVSRRCPCRVVDGVPVIFWTVSFIL